MGLQVAILAAGQGTRMRSALPKVLQPIAGKPLLAHVLDAARPLKPQAICVVYGSGRGGDQVRTALEAPDLVWARQDPPLGTGDALKCALRALPSATTTLATIGDIPLIRSETLRALAHAGTRALTVLTARVADPTGLGRIVRDAHGQLTAIVEEKDATPEIRAITEINTGVMAGPTELFARLLGQLDTRNAQGEYYLTDVIALAHAEGHAVGALVADDSNEIQGVNDRAQLARVERVIQRARADALLRSGVGIADPARFDDRGTLTCGRDVRIDVGCVFSGRVALGDEVSIAPYCVLNDVTVGAGTRIEAFSHLDQAVIGANCRVGPYARIRPATTLANDVHIGNYVEVKASTIGEGSKANHLAYVGDSTVGRNVNIGAGAITCNYDGANKHRTVIEDDVFVGSDTQFVAPVTVHRGATIGAGTTIWKDVPADALATNAKTQSAKPGYQRPVKQTTRKA